MSRLATLAGGLRASRGIAHKRDIAPVVRALGLSGTDAVPVGDDTAVIPDGRGGNLLLAIEGFVADFVDADPWFAGYCAVMVNVSDVAAMGGTPLAIVDALWAADAAGAAPVLAGMREAAAKYGVPIVGGHSNLKSSDGQLAAAILGRTDHPITSFDARPGDLLVVATDLRGAFRDPFPWWDASTGASGAQLRGDIALLPSLATDGLVTAGKDISMAGVAGTAMMLAEASGTGVRIDLERLPMPPLVTLERWLTAFPSFGFVLSVRPDAAAQVIERFTARGIAAAVTGSVLPERRAEVVLGKDTATVWDFADPFTGCSAFPPAEPRETIHA